MRKPLVLIEPASCTTNQGHYLEKLQLWIDGARRAGYEPLVVGWHAPQDDLGVRTIAVESAWSARLVRLMPKRRWPRIIETLVYRVAFREARRLRCPCIGLTASNPVPIVLGSILQGPHPSGHGQILMYCGLHRIKGTIRLRKICELALAKIQRKGGLLLPNSPATLNWMRQSPHISERVHYLEDPTKIPAIDEGEIARKTEAPNQLLINGADNHRRFNLGHFGKHGGLECFSGLVVQIPGSSHPCLADGGRWMPPAALDYKFIGRYLERDDLIRLFANAKFTAIIYHPNHRQGSGHFAYSIACGTPVLCSDFPHARVMFSRYGRIGEMFEYDNPESFHQAIRRLISWSRDDFEEFIHVRRRFVADHDHHNVVKRALDLIHPVPAD